jgi:DNA-binding GntR family transcriptional regulator
MTDISADHGNRAKADPAQGSGKARTLDEAAPAGRLLSDLAYERVLEKLFDRTLPAGAFVSQSQLVGLLGIPVAPLRDALRVLEAEGVLTIHPRSGIQFVKPGKELTQSTYQFRVIIERAAVRVFAEVADDALIAEIELRHLQFLPRLEKRGALGPEVLEEMEELETLLHDSVIGILANPLVETTYRRMHNYLRLVRLDRKLTVPLALKGVREHLTIINAVKTRDPDAAEAALVAHFGAALQRHLGMFL